MYKATPVHPGDLILHRIWLEIRAQYLFQNKGVVIIYGTGVLVENRKS